MSALQRITSYATVFILLCTALISTTSLYAQAPEGVNYQAVARNNIGDPLSNQIISVRFSVIANSTSGAVLYQEDHSAISTNEFGLFNLIIGQGTRTGGSLANFSLIDWSTGTRFLGVQVDAGSGFENLGTTQMLSVPYALYAKTSGSSSNAPKAGNGIIIRNDTIINDGDISETNELISSFSLLAGNILRITEASTDYDVDLSSILPTSTDDQNLSFSSNGDSILIENGDGISIKFITDTISNFRTRISNNTSNISINNQAIIDTAQNIRLSLADSASTLRALIGSGSDDQNLSFSPTRDSILIENGNGIRIQFILDTISSYNTRIGDNKSDISMNNQAIIDTAQNIRLALVDSANTLRTLIGSGSDDQNLSFNQTGDSILIENGDGLNIQFITDTIANYNSRIIANKSDAEANANDIVTNQNDITVLNTDVSALQTNFSSDSTLTIQNQDSIAILTSLLGVDNDADSTNELIDSIRFVNNTLEIYQQGVASTVSLDTLYDSRRLTLFNRTIINRDSIDAVVAIINALGNGGIYNGTGSLSGNTEVIQGANTMSFTSTATNAFSIDTTTFAVNAATNKVGIGTATLNSSSSLEINGIGFYGAGLELRNGGSRVALSNNGSSFQVIKVDGGTNVQMSIENATGEVGIGTSAPAYLLDVNGTFSANSINVNDLYDLPDTAGTIGQILKADAGGNPIWEDAPVSGGVFEKVAGVIRDTTADYSSDFVIGSPQLDDDADATHDNRLFFDKSKGAFRAGIANSTQWNDASVGIASIAFGENNTANGLRSVILGGEFNTASASFTTITGGRLNTASALYSTIVGGSENSASGGNDFIGGGLNNVTTGPYATIPGGFADTVSGQYSTIGGGRNNTVSGNLSIIGGGRLNNVSGSLSTIGGGDANLASGQYSTIGGGDRNTASGNESTIAGGIQNSAGTRSFVGGGANNNASGATSFIGGGVNQIASGAATVIGGGAANTTSNTYDVVAGGQSNTAGGGNSFIGGGASNTTSGIYATIGGGQRDTASGSYSTIGGGIGNNSSGIESTVAGGDRNTASGNESFVGGGVRNSATATWSAVSGGAINSALRDGAFVGGGGTNIAGGVYSSILGGSGNRAQSLYEVVVGSFNDTLLPGFSPTAFNLSDRLFVIGNGTAGNLRSNALVMLKNGNTTLNGALTLSNGISSFTLPNTDGTAGQTLQTNGSGVVTWTSTAATCPVGMTSVNGNICIETNERAASDWYDAAQTCTSLGYKLPTWSEWYGAATNAVLTNETNNWEWVSDGTSNTARKVGNTTLKNTANDDPESGSANFRCIYYR